ncbi:MAG: hypothetical protein JWO58_75 [Chitinophagaceae bacterium]|nr:hypothetical protein [Chitinophagaceae bacterium]
MYVISPIKTITMNKLFIVLLALLLASNFSFAQTTVKLGTPYAVIDARLKSYFAQDDEILTVKIDGKKIILQKLSVTYLNYIDSKTYEDMPDGYMVEEVIEHNKRYFVFYSLWDKPNKTEQLFYREIDFKSGAFMAEGKRIVAVDQKIVGGYSFNFSNDNSRMLVQYRLKPDVKDDSKSYDIIGLSVFDQNVFPVWGKEVKMPYTEKKMNIIDYSVDSQGNAYTLATVYNDNSTDEKKRGEDVANYHMELLRITPTANNIDITPIKVNSKFVTGVWMFEGPTNEMLCAGFYNSSGNSNAADGIFLSKLNKDGQLYDQTTYEIPLEIINEYVSARQKRKNEKKEEEDAAELNNLVLRNLIVQQDGSVLLVGERYYVTSTSYYDFQTKRTRTTTVYHYEDMFITKLTSDSKLAWMKKLPKRQTLSTSSSSYGYGSFFTYQYRAAMRGGLSYKYMSGDHKHYLIFLDNEKNKDLTTDKVPATHVNGAGGFVTAYEINDNDGKATRHSVFDMRDVQGMEVYQFSVDRILPTSSNQFVLEEYKKKKEDILIQVTFPK